MCVLPLLLRIRHAFTVGLGRDPILDDHRWRALARSWPVREPDTTANTCKPRLSRWRPSHLETKKRRGRKVQDSLLLGWRPSLVGWRPRSRNSFRSKKDGHRSPWHRHLVELCSFPETADRSPRSSIKEGGLS